MPLDGAVILFPPYKCTVFKLKVRNFAFYLWPIEIWNYWPLRPPRSLEAVRGRFFVNYLSTVMMTVAVPETRRKYTHITVCNRHWLLIHESISWLTLEFNFRFVCCSNCNTMIEMGTNKKSASAILPINMKAARWNRGTTIRFGCCLEAWRWYEEELVVAWFLMAENTDDVFVYFLWGITKRRRETEGAEGAETVLSLQSPPIS